MTLAILALVTLLFPPANASGVIVDDFDSYTAGAVISGPNWNPKWANGTQQNLFRADANGGGYAVLNTSVAERLYHITNQNGFTINSGQTIRISSDFRYSYTGGGDITSDFNKNAFGFLLSDQPQWWNGTNKYFSMANRGSAMGNTLPVAPWVETWMPHGKLGLDTAASGTSEWFNIEWTLSVIDNSVWGSAVITDDEGSQTDSQSSTPVDLGFAPGSTLYAGFSTDWNNVGAVPIESFSKIDAVHIDNFSIVSVPEASAFLFGGLICGMFGMNYARRRRTADVEKC